jgi:hypothetical protein
MLGLRRRTADDYEGKRWICVSYLALEDWATLGTWDRIAWGLNTGIYISYRLTAVECVLSLSICALCNTCYLAHRIPFEVSKSPEYL